MHVSKISLVSYNLKVTLEMHVSKISLVSYNLKVTLETYVSNIKKVLQKTQTKII